MTYRELLEQLQKLNDEQLDSDVCIWDTYGCEGTNNDEYYQATVDFVFATEECQVLDIDHPIIRF